VAPIAVARRVRREAKGKAQSVLRVLERRRIDVSAAQRERILGSSDIQTLDRRLDAAVTAVTADELFG
jgi:hypothetical protein